MHVHESIQLLHRRKSALIRALVVSLTFLILYAWLYKDTPLPDYWNTLAVDFLNILAALAAALSGTLLIRQFQPDEKPHLIWLCFILGWWSWLLGEIASTGYDLLKITAGDISVYDLFWTLGYLCFGLALYFQYRHIYGSRKESEPGYFLLVVALTLLVTLGFTQIALWTGLGQGKSWFATYLVVFYPVCDVFIGIAALWLSFLFGRGSWGRPWWALVVFAAADSVDTFQWIGGNKLITDNVANFLNWTSGVVYAGGYLVAMLGFLSILLYHLSFSRPKSPDAGQIPA